MTKNVLPMVCLILLALVSVASAQPFLTTATLRGDEEVPAISTTGNGIFIGVVDPDNNTIQYSLFYVALEGTVSQAHIHLGQHSVNGGIMLFLCTNQGNGPPGTPTCDASGGVSGTLEAADVVGPTDKGIGDGEMDEAISAIRQGLAYVNVHTSLHSGGEIRGQIR